MFTIDEVFSKLSFICYQKALATCCRINIKENINGEPRLLSFAAFKTRAYVQN